MKAAGLSEAAVKTHCGNVKTIMREREAVIGACPDAEWALLFGLARYAGLRVPSETHRLTWADVSFDRARLTVHSPKTEHHEGHERRIVPIDPRLMKLLQDRFAECEEGDDPGQGCGAAEGEGDLQGSGGDALAAAVADAALQLREGVGDAVPAVRRQSVDRPQPDHFRPALCEQCPGRVVRQGRWLGP